MLANKNTNEDKVYESLLQIGEQLQKLHYEFRTITPVSHGRILKRYANKKNSCSLDIHRQIFGWSLPFNRNLLQPAIFDELEKGGLLVSNGDNFKSSIRFSTFSDHDHPIIFAHSAFPTVESDSIFFGPDTYRSFYFLKKACQYVTPSNKYRVLDIGAGSGAGGIFLAKEIDRKHPACKLDVVLTDINSRALIFSRANATLNCLGAQNIQFEYIESNLYKSLEGSFDFIFSNPPYMVDLESKSADEASGGSSRLYRDGGGARGIDLALRIVKEGLPRLQKGGILALYTGVPIIEGGKDIFWEEVQKIDTKQFQLVEYEEIDPDVWGEELDGQAYADVERIAVVGLIITRIK